jgi:hypothetical protein
MATKSVVARVRLCNWFFEAGCNEELDPLLPHFTDVTINKHVNRVLYFGQQIATRDAVK